MVLAKVYLADRRFRRKLIAVFMDCEDRLPIAHMACGRRADREARDMAVVPLAKALGDQDVERAPENFSARIAEGTLRAIIEHGDGLRVVHADDGIRRQCNDPREAIISKACGVNRTAHGK
jgi:hypothetical protein